MDIHIELLDILEFCVVWSLATFLRNTYFPYLSGMSEHLFRIEVYGLYLLFRYIIRL